MSALNVLRAVAAASQGTIEGALPPHIVRFTLEYDAAPDLAAESKRIEAFLQSDRFSLERFDPDLQQFLILQFPGVSRRISTPTLYAMAAELARGLDLVSCVPDVGVPVVTDPGPDGSATESALGDAILNFTCWAKKDDELSKRWAIESIRADKAWAVTKGAGVLIAQPDTGVSPHVELEAGALDKSKAWNILNNTSDPTDPLSDAAGNPGHGTATSSTVISRLLGRIAGSAPEAQVVPIRCVDSVILGLDGSPIARAVLHAKRIGADVISMSLGGPFYSPSLAAAIAQAVDEGVIVCAAAGNCVQPIVVYPASDPNVIALAGIDHDDKPWKGTSRGPKVDAAAPAENVFVARRSPFDGGVGTIEPSQGTSFATALTAGVAALWVAHFGRDAIRAQAKKNGVKVHHLFRAALRKSARPPRSGTWDSWNFGAGIVDAEALLKLPLDQIPAAPPMPPAVATQQPEAAVIAVMIEAVSRNQGDFDWKRHGAEAVYLATDAWRRASPARDMLVESAQKPTPSTEIMATAPAVLRAAIGQADDAPAMQPPLVGEPARREFIRSLGAHGMGGTESAATTTIEAAQARLQGAGLDALRQLAADTCAKLDAEDTTSAGVAARRGIQESVVPIVQQLLSGGPVALSAEHRANLEALVAMKGRPSFRVVNGTIDPNDPMFGEWGGSLIAQPELPALTGAVGRIDGDGTHIGTGFVIADSIVMTNRHVLEAIAEEVGSPTGSTWIFSFGEVTIDFSENANGSARFRVKSVIGCGPDPIEGKVRFPRLDMALLEVETSNAAGQKLPAPLPLIDERP
ncbi:serine protease, partial [Bradyrhizobium liaoningense]